MTHDEFISIVKQPESVSAGHVADLKEMIEYYPYFVQPRILLAKASLNAKNIHAQSYINQAALYCSDRRWLYYYLYPDKKISKDTYRYDRVPKYSGNYFDLINFVESEEGETKQSLKNLAERLKSARALVGRKPDESTVKEIVKTESIASTVLIPLPDYFVLNDNISEQGMEISEEYAKKLIKEKKFREAIEILKKLNLINPKKSIYFADQIRFLEKALLNSKKQT
ncbi:MAG: hypothetical protein LLF95_04225 [Bacteroidales bacterium]|nr:hypothetical protein [Bacteroidales bacterium]